MYVCAHVVQIFVCFYPYGEASFCLCINKRCYLQSFDSAAVYIYNVCACVYIYIYMCVCDKLVYISVYTHAHAVLYYLRHACTDQCTDNRSTASCLHAALWRWVHSGWCSARCKRIQGTRALTRQSAHLSFSGPQVAAATPVAIPNSRIWFLCDEWQPQSPNPKQLAAREFEAD